MSQAATDVFAAIGRTDRGRRASTAFTSGGSFWVHGVELRRDVQVAANPAPQRSNPPRRARRPPIRELSTREINDVTPLDVEAGNPLEKRASNNESGDSARSCLGGRGASPSSAAGGRNEGMSAQAHAGHTSRETFSRPTHLRSEEEAGSERGASEGGTSDGGVELDSLEEGGGDSDEDMIGRGGSLGEYRLETGGSNDGEGGIQGYGLDCESEDSDEDMIV